MSNAYGDPDPKADTGRKGYLEPDEPSDGFRRRIAYRPFWRDESEQVTYEHIAENYPRRRSKDGQTWEGPGTYIARISDLAQKRIGAKRDAIADLARSKAMPAAEQKYLTDATWNDRNNALQAQREEI
jgi:hypothetical protein